MTQLSESAQWGSVYQLAQGDPANAGPVTFSGDDPTAGHSNAQAQRLVNRTLMLRNRMGWRRNLLVAGPIDGDTQPVYASASGLVVTISDLHILFSAGFSEIGPVDYYWQQSSNLVYDFTTASATSNFHAVFAVYNTSTGAVTLEVYPVDASTNPWKVTGTAPAHSADLFWHNPFTGETKQSNGTTWTDRVAVHLLAVDTTSGNAIVLHNPYHIQAQYEDPIGSIRQRLDVGPLPYGWFACIGVSLSIGLYRHLYDEIGTTYGSGSGTFDIPTIGNQSLGNATVQTIIRLV